jgi:hypothetical protein
MCVWGCPVKEETKFLRGTWFLCELLLLLR